jgi:pimeloyl-ACP methyl ester carboxylesterase
MRFSKGLMLARAGMLVAGAALASGCETEKSQESEMPKKDSAVAPTLNLHVDDGGTGGLPVVFVHSFAGSTAHWSNQLAHLRATRRAVALDLRGHGQSATPTSGAYAVDSLAGDIASVVDKLGVTRFVLVGHSMGGAAAIDYAGAHPDRVAGLVLVGTPGKSPPEQRTKIMSSMNADYDKVSEGYWKTLLTGAQPTVETQIRTDLKRVPREASLAIIDAIFAYDPLPSLQAFPGPKLIIDTKHGDGPGALHKQAQNVPRVVLTGTSHWPHMDKPEAFNRELDAFLAKVS